MSTRLQWNPSCEGTPFAQEASSFKRGEFSSGEEVDTFKFRFKLPSDLSRGVTSLKGFYCIIMLLTLY